MTTTTFELRFEVSGMTRAIEDDLYAGHDVLVSEHDSVTIVTVEAEGPDCLSACLAQIERLMDAGLRVSRLVEDLVSASEIAERAGMTRQAVGNWVRGDRHANNPFPAPYAFTPDRIWLWGEVVHWLRQRGMDQDPGVEFPTRLDHTRANWELSCTSRAGSTWVGATTAKIKANAFVTRSPERDPERLFGTDSLLAGLHR